MHMRGSEAMRRVVVQSVLIVLALLVASPRAVNADPGSCRATIIDATAKHAQSSFRAFRDCQDRIVVGLLPDDTDCAARSTTSARLAHYDASLRRGIERACGGANASCNVADVGADADDLPGAIDFPSICPGFEGA